MAVVGGALRTLVGPSCFAGADAAGRQAGFPTVTGEPAADLRRRLLSNLGKHGERVNNTLSTLSRL